MRNIRGTLHSLPNQQTLTIVAQDPSIAPNDILTAQVRIPAEELIDGPCGYRVHVIDYDATSNILYEPAKLRPDPEGGYVDPFAVDDDGPGQTRKPKGYDTKLLTDPTFHAQNVYAIVMRTLARFEFALGRRVAWGSNGHQIHVAPHAFADANAFYSRDDRAIFFGYFPGNDGKTVFTCLSHDVVAHETTHALLDGLRARYMEQSSPDQAAFHEGFADVVALLSVFSLPEIIGELLDRTPKASANTIDEKFLKPEALRQSALFGLAEEMGSAISAVRGEALRRSVTLERGKRYMSMAEFDEPHQRGELLVAAMMNAFLDIWNARTRANWIRGQRQKGPQRGDGRGCDGS